MPEGKFDFDTIFLGVILAVMLLILIIAARPVWLYMLFEILICLLIVVALGGIVVFAASWLWVNKFKTCVPNGEPAI